MKNLVFISSFLVAMMFAAVSCSKKNDPVPVPVQKQITTTWTIPIKGYAGQTSIVDKFAINLADVSGVDAKNFISGEFQNSGGSIQISGLNKMDGVVLNNFSIQVNSAAAVNFGKVTANPGTNDFESDVQQSGDKVNSLLKSLFTAYTGNSKTANLTITFTPSGDINPADNVKLLVVILGKYNWNTFPNN